MRSLFLTAIAALLALSAAGQTLSAGLTLTPDSLFFDTYLKQTTVLSNHTSQPIQVTSVQSNCQGCISWSWRVDHMSFIPPHWIYPGQTDSVTIQVFGSVQGFSPAGYLHSTLEIGTGAGSLLCHLFINQILITATGEQAENHVKIYPNPATTGLTFEIPGAPALNSSVEIYDFTGRRVFGQAVQDSKRVLGLDAFPNGLYTAVIKVGNDRTVSRFVKK